MTPLESSPIRAVAWDIDGTLIDSEPLHEAVLREVCAGYGADVSDTDPERFRGLHMPDVWRALRPRLPAGLTGEEWQETMILRYVARAGELRPLPGAREVMQKFADAGLRQVCVSNSGRRVVDANLRILAVDGLIEFSLSLDDVAAGKPDPEPYAAAARRLGLEAGAMAAVEDSVAGATSAHRAGLRVFALAVSGVHRAPARRTVRRLDELLPLILPAPADPSTARERVSNGL